MGFFSWKTSDSKISIPNRYSSMCTFTVHMVTRDGRVFTENTYDGYGEFGGKDFYELLAEINPGQIKTRDAGIDLAFKDNSSGEYNGNFEMPKLVEHLPITREAYPDISEEEYMEKFQRWFDSLDYPETCENQGYFYPDDDDEDDEEDDEDDDWFNDSEDEDEDNI